MNGRQINCIPFSVRQALNSIGIILNHVPAGSKRRHYYSIMRKRQGKMREISWGSQGSIQVAIRRNFVNMVIWIFVFNSKTIVYILSNQFYPNVYKDVNEIPLLSSMRCI